MAERYTILTIDGLVESEDHGLYAGNTTHKIFGTLACKSGMRMSKEHRVFFHSLEDAITCGYPLARTASLCTGRSSRKCGRNWAWAPGQAESPRLPTDPEM